MRPLKALAAEQQTARRAMVVQLLTAAALALAARLELGPEPEVAVQ